MREGKIWQPLNGKTSETEKTTEKEKDSLPMAEAH